MKSLKYNHFDFVIIKGASLYLLLSAILVFISGCDLKNTAPEEISVDSDPSGASLSINGTETGRTPYKLKTPAFGKYLFRFSKEGYTPVEKIVDITASTSADMIVSLPKLTGLVLFDSTPPGADLTVNGAFRGKTPVLVTDLPTGSYKATFKLEGYDPREMEVMVADRIPKLCDMSMKSIYAAIKVQSDPPGANVIIDGIDKGKTPCSVEDVLQGEHTLKLIKPGFKEYIEKINLSKVEETPINIRLNEILAAIEVISNPAEARVTLDNELKGRTPLVISGLRDGTYSIEIEKPGYEKLTKEVVIKNKEDGKLDVTLDKATGGLVLNVLPLGSTIVIASTENKAISGSTPYSVDLAPGSYDVEVTKAGYDRFSSKLEVKIRETTTKTISLNKIFVKDTIVALKDGRIREGMIATKYPNGGIKIETAPGIFEEFTAGEILSVTDKK
jgi:hypothetical protein